MVVFLSTEKICGNTVIDPGEECDCGDENECTDPCCNPKTCKLIGTCSPFIHSCCDSKTCTATKERRLCRTKQHETCDVPEYCSGEIDCPKDATNDFLSCKKNNILGNCYAGQCVSHNISCLELKETHESVVGPCKRAIYGDIACGDLYCQYGTYGYCTYFQTVSRVQVPEGVKCGENKHCINKICKDINPINFKTLSPTFMPVMNPTKKPLKKKPNYYKKCKLKNRKKMCRWQRLRKGKKIINT